MKKISIFLSAVVLTCSFTINISARELNSVEEMQFVEKTEEQLEAIQSMKSEYGFSDDENFQSLILGKEIPTMEYAEGELIPTNWNMYSIVDNNENLIALALKSGIAGEMVCTISTEYVNEMSRLYDNSSPFALIYDATKAYIVTDEDVLLLKSYPVISNRDTIETDNELLRLFQQMKETIAGNELEQTLVVSAMNNSAINSRTIYTSNYLNVRRESQIVNGTYYPICWACSAASVGDYISGASYSGYQFANMTYGTASGRNKTEAASAMQLVFGQEYRARTAAYTFSEVMKYINAGYPIYGSFKSSSGEGHAAVIRGYNVSSSIFSVMDPLTAGGYTNGTVTSSGALRFVTAYNGTVFTNDGGVNLNVSL